MRNGSKPKTRKAPAAPNSAIRIEASSGNVFADLGLPNPDLALAKADIVQRIRALIAGRKLTQMKAATILGIGQSKVSALVCGRVEGYSLDRLLRFLTSLGQQVEITVRPKAATGRTNGRAVVVR